MLEVPAEESAAECKLNSPSMKSRMATLSPGLTSSSAVTVWPGSMGVACTAGAATSSEMARRVAVRISFIVVLPNDNLALAGLLKFVKQEVRQRRRSLKCQRYAVEMGRIL